MISGLQTKLSEQSVSAWCWDGSESNPSRAGPEEEERREWSMPDLAACCTVSVLRVGNALFSSLGALLTAKWTFGEGCGVICWGMDVVPLAEKERVDFFLASGWRFPISQVIDSKSMPSLFQGIRAGGKCGPICSIPPASFTAIGWYVSPSSVVLSSVTSSSESLQELLEYGMPYLSSPDSWQIRGKSSLSSPRRCPRHRLVNILFFFRPLAFHVMLRLIAGPARGKRWSPTSRWNRTPARC